MGCWGAEFINVSCDLFSDIMEEIKIWIKTAEKDLNAAEINIDNELYDYAAFLAQQAAEKALKALYLKKFKRIRKVHDLVALAKELDAPQELMQKCKELTPAYLYNRYPDVAPVENINEVAKDLLKYAEEIVAWVKQKL